MYNSPFGNSEWNKYPLTPRTHEHFQKEVKKVKPLTINDLFPQLDRWAIGYSTTLNTLQDLAKAKAPSYPPYNITKFEDGKWQIEMAVAGFRKDDIELKVQDRTLTVSSEVVEPEEEETFGEVLHHGIAQRNFKTTFALAEYVEVDSAKLEDGILTIGLVTNIPDEKKPRVIEIN